MKIYITGGSGTGKSTYARVLSQKYSMPYLELDTVKWIKNADKSFTKYRSRQERVQILDNFLAGNKCWICEGSYNQDWINGILKNADVVLIVWAPIWVRHYRCVRRAFQAENIKKLSLGALWKLLVWSHGYDKTYLPALKAKLHDYGVPYITVNYKRLGVGR